MTTYKDDMTTSDYCGVLKGMIFRNIGREDAEALAFFKKVVRANSKLVGPEMNKMLKLAADGNFEMFKIAASGFVNLTRSHFKEILEGRTTPKPVLDYIDARYPSK